MPRETKADLECRVKQLERDLKRANHRAVRLINLKAKQKRELEEKLVHARNEVTTRASESADNMYRLMEGVIDVRRKEHQEAIRSLRDELDGCKSFLERARNTRDKYAEFHNLLDQILVSEIIDDEVKTEAIKALFAGARLS